MDRFRSALSARRRPAYSNLHVGWEASGYKHTRFVESAIRQAAALPRRQGHPIEDGTHHTLGDVDFQLTGNLRDRLTTFLKTGSRRWRWSFPVPRRPLPPARSRAYG